MILRVNLYERIAGEGKIMKNLEGWRNASKKSSLKNHQKIGERRR